MLSDDKDKLHKVIKGCIKSTIDMHPDLHVGQMPDSIAKRVTGEVTALLDESARKLEEAERAIQEMKKIAIAREPFIAQLQQQLAEAERYLTDGQAVALNAAEQTILQLQQQFAEARKQIEAARETCCHPAGDCFDAALEASRAAE